MYLSRLPSRYEVVFDAFGNLYASRGRAVLALTGITIGTAAVIAMLHVGHNARLAAMREFDSLGIDFVSIVPREGKSGPTVLSLTTVLALPSQKIGIAQVVPLISAGVIVRMGRGTFQANLIAATDGLYALAKVPVVKGRTTSDLDKFASYAVLGADIAQEISATSGKQLRIGDQLSVDDQTMTVIGILASTFPNPMLNIDLNHTVVIPFGAARRLVPNPRISSVAARLTKGADDYSTAQKVSEYFQSHSRQGNIQIQTARQLIDGLEQQMRVYGLLLLAIGTVALIVGGVGIMNVMLMNVMERRREIGLRIAIGARRRDIRIMFLTEALVLAGFGSFLGTGLGTLVGWMFAEISGWSFLAAPLALPLGVGMALVVGLVFGSYPASRAAQLDPIAALRAD